MVAVGPRDAERGGYDAGCRGLQVAAPPTAIKIPAGSVSWERALLEFTPQDTLMRSVC